MRWKQDGGISNKRWEKDRSFLGDDGVLPGLFFQPNFTGRLCEFNFEFGGKVKAGSPEGQGEFGGAKGTTNTGVSGPGGTECS